MGAFVIMLYGSWFGGGRSDPIGNAEIFWPFMVSMLGLLSFGLFTLNMHLGKPMRFYRGFNNWRLSPVSREIAGVTLFFMGLGAYAFAGLLGPNFLHFINLDGARLLAYLAAIPALIGVGVGLYYMIKLYLIPARPFWNHWQTASSFVGSALTLGTLLIGAAAIVALGGRALHSAAVPLAVLALAGLALEAIGLFFHARAMKRQGGEGAASHFEQTSRYGKTYLTRNFLLLVNMAALAAIIIFGLPAGASGALLAIGLLVSILTSAILGRALFYVLVIPTTMPGAFFWRNKGFEQHAVKSGLAGRIEAGIESGHH